MGPVFARTTNRVGSGGIVPTYPKRKFTVVLYRDRDLLPRRMSLDPLKRVFTK